MKAASFRDLRIWQESMEITVEIYRLTRAFPKDEMFGLISQIRRSASSIAANIAEGKGRDTLADYMRFLFIARGSANETVSHCLLAEKLGYFDSQQANSIIGRLEGLRAGIQACISSLKVKRFPATVPLTTSPANNLTTSK